MELIQLVDFQHRTLGGRPCQMEVSIYGGLPFDCACGRSHNFDPTWVRVLRELPKMRLVLSCPQDMAVNCVRIRGLFRRRLETLFGAKIDEADL